MTITERLTFNIGAILMLDIYTSLRKYFFSDHIYNTILRPVHKLYRKCKFRRLILLNMATINISKEV